MLFSKNTYEREKIQMKSSWKRKLIHIMATVDQLMLVFIFSYKKNIKAEHTLNNISEAEQSYFLPLIV